MTEIMTQLANDLGNELKNRHLTLSVAESCTGGGLAFWITSIPGSSAWFDRGFITYSNNAKAEMLGVTSLTLTVFGSVSEQTVREMAEGALKNSQANISIAITGIAGPDGGTPDKPVGTVWIACAGKQLETKPTVDIFPGNRQVVRESTIQFALRYLIDYIRSSLL